MTTRLLTLIIKEFKAIWKDPRSRMIVTIMPIIQLIVFANAVTMEVKNPIVTMEVKDFGTIKLELYPEMAPDTVANFIALANHGFYDGLKFHRVVKGFMIQGGDSNGDGTGSPELSDIGLAEAGTDSDKKYCITGEFLANGYENKIKNTDGVISMARSMAYNSASSQFFIMHKDYTGLDGAYAAFGKVTSGIEIVDKICEDVKIEDDNGTVLKENQPVIEKIEMID